MSARPMVWSTLRWMLRQQAGPFEKQNWSGLQLKMATDWWWWWVVVVVVVVVVLVVLLRLLLLLLLLLMLLLLLLLLVVVVVLLLLLLLLLLPSPPPFRPRAPYFTYSALSPPQPSRARSCWTAAGSAHAV